MEKEFEERGGEWKELLVEKVFDIKNTLSFNKDVLTNGNDFDYVTRTSQNQGILKTTGFVNNENINKAGNWSLGLLQMDFFYRNKPWYAGQFVRKIEPKIQLSRRSILFFTTLLNKLKPDLLSGLVRDVDDIFLNSKILLPMINNEIDFNFIDRFINSLEVERLETLEAERIETLEAYLQVTNLKNYKLTRNDKKILDTFEKLNDTKSRVEEWREYPFEQLFNIYTGRDVIIGKTEIGNTPLISHQHQNNGIAQRIKNLSDRRLFDNKTTLSLADRGVFCSKSQSEKFHIGTRVKALEFKDGEKNKKAQLFFVATINKLQILFKEYSSNATDKLPDLNIQLPTKNGEVDYQFMSDFIRVIEKIVIKNVIEWTDRKIQATKEVISNE